MHEGKGIAECFSVNTSTVYRLEKRMRETGSVETRVFQRGRKCSLKRSILKAYTLPFRYDVCLALVYGKLFCLCPDSHNIRSQHCCPFAVNVSTDDVLILGIGGEPGYLYCPLFGFAKL